MKNVSVHLHEGVADFRLSQMQESGIKAGTERSYSTPFPGALAVLRLCHAFGSELELHQSGPAVRPCVLGREEDATS